MYGEKKDPHSQDANSLFNNERHNNLDPGKNWGY